MDRLQVVLDNIYARRSCRDYIPGRPVTREQTMTLLRAAMAAPSACNLQPWEFVVVDDAAQIKSLRPLIGGGQYDVPLMMVVCARTEVVPWGGEGWMVDCAAAIENMFLTATAMGLGSLWIGDFDRDGLCAALDIPEGVAPVNVVYFGWPAREKAPCTRYKDEAVYWGRYDPARPHAPRTTEGMIREAEEDA